MNDCKCDEGVVASPARYNKAASCENRCLCLSTIKIPAKKGGDAPTDPYAPKLGAEQNKIVIYEATGSVYLYDSNGVYTNLTGESLANAISALQQQLTSLTERVDGVSDYLDLETADRKMAIAELQASIQALQTALAQETADRKAGDESLEQQIATISASTGDISADFANKLVAEQEARQFADAELEEKLTTVQEAVADEATTREQAVQQLTTSLAEKQDLLVSGGNIKTINGMTLLGSGNIEVAGGGSSVELYTQETSSTGSITKNSGVPLIQTSRIPIAWSSTTGTKGSGIFDFSVPYGDNTPCVNISLEIPEDVRVALSEYPDAKIFVVEVSPTRADFTYTLPVRPSSVPAASLTLNITAIGIDLRQ